MTVPTELARAQQRVANAKQALEDWSEGLANSNFGLPEKETRSQAWWASTTKDRSRQLTRELESAESELRDLEGELGVPTPDVAEGTPVAASDAGLNAPVLDPAAQSRAATIDREIGDGPNAPFLDEGDELADHEKRKRDRLGSGDEIPWYEREKVPETVDAVPVTHEQLLPPPRKFQVIPEGLEDPEEQLRKLERVEIPTLPHGADLKFSNPWREVERSSTKASDAEGPFDGYGNRDTRNFAEILADELAPHLRFLIVFALLFAVVAGSAFALAPRVAPGVTASPPSASVVATVRPVAPAPSAPTAAPVGATLTVVPVYRFPVTEDCPDVPGSQRDPSGQTHVLRLAPRVVSNPDSGVSARYDWGMHSDPGPRCTWTLTLEYERTPGNATASLLFPPSTTYSFVQTLPTRAPGGGRQLATILTVTNGSR